MPSLWAELWLYPDGQLAGNDGWTSEGTSGTIAAHRYTGDPSTDGEATNEGATASLDRTKEWQWVFPLTLTTAYPVNSMSLRIGEDGNGIELDVIWDSTHPGKADFFLQSNHTGYINIAADIPHAIRIHWANDLLELFIDDALIATVATLVSDWGAGPIFLNPATGNGGFFIDAMQLQGSTL